MALQASLLELLHEQTECEWVSKINVLWAHTCTHVHTHTPMHVKVHARMHYFRLTRGYNYVTIAGLFYYWMATETIKNKHLARICDRNYYRVKS